MSRGTRSGRLALFVALLLASAARSAGTDEGGRALLTHARKAVSSYHAGSPRSGGTLRVVYFVPADVEPLPDYAGRLGRVMDDVDGFYREGLARFGLESCGIPLERQGGKLVIHLVRGKRPAGQYHHSSGDVTRAEIRDALRGTVDLDREHVLVFYALCRKEPDGRYVFDAPYYGGGDQRAGFCHAADCERLDPLMLRDTSHRIVYTEHYYPRVEESVAEFNTKYLGGTAHELGHGLGLPHDDGGPGERRSGVSLMGRGNLSYRRDVWRGGPAAYLSRASALRLISHPLITGSDRGRREEAGGRIDSLRFSSGPGAVRVEGVVRGDIPPYAVIAYVWPTRDTTDHGARTYPDVVGEGGRFSLDLDGLRPGSYHLRLAGLHANGSATTLDMPLAVNVAGEPDTTALGGAMVRRAEEAVMARGPEARSLVSDRALSDAPTPEARRRLRLLRAILEPRPPIDLGAATGNRAWLSDAAWTDARVGWGQVERNSFWFDDQFRIGVLLQLGGRVYEKGLYAHSPSRYAFALDGKWKRFRSVVGLRDGAHAEGSAVFIVLGDGREIGRSRILRAGDREELGMDVAGVRRLELRTEGGEGHNHNSWAIWVEPEVSR